MTISTHFCPNIFPSGSTTAYFLGLLHKTCKMQVVTIFLTFNIFRRANLKCDIELVRIVNGNYSFVCCLVFIIKVKLDWKHKHRNFPVQNTRGRWTCGAHFARIQLYFITISLWFVCFLIFAVNYKACNFLS